jgi:hypothetical protein
MKNSILIFIILLFNLTYGFGQNNVGIGTNAPDTNAILELQATDKGILIPRMTSPQRNNMAPSLGLTQKGLLVFDNDSTKFFFWNGYMWQSIDCGAMGPQGPPGIVPTRHWIGEHYQGGIIFYVDSSGQHGLIAAPVDQSVSASWSNVTNILIGPSAQSYTNGLSNTNAIIAQPGHVQSAANICKSYNGGGYNDWYLPSRQELLMLQANSYGIAGISYVCCSNYWSSTEYDATQAIELSFFTNSIGSSPKGSAFQFRVRAIRRF